MLEFTTQQGNSRSYSCNVLIDIRRTKIQKTFSVYANPNSSEGMLPTFTRTMCTDELFVLLSRSVNCLLVCHLHLFVLLCKPHDCDRHRCQQQLGSRYPEGFTGERLGDEGDSLGGSSTVRTMHRADRYARTNESHCQIFTDLRMCMSKTS